MKIKHSQIRKPQVTLLALLLAVLMSITTVAPPACATDWKHSASDDGPGSPTYGNPYFADVGDGYIYYDCIKWGNDRGAFGKKRGKEYHFNSLDDLKQGEYVQWVFNLYHKKVGFGNKKYSKKAKKSWQWAQSLGIIGKKAKPNSYATWTWTWEVLDRLGKHIDGGGTDTTTYVSRQVVTRRTAMFNIWSFGNIPNDKYDPRNL